MSRITWSQLDRRLRGEVEASIGTVVEAQPLGHPSSSTDLLCVLYLESRQRVVVKGCPYPSASQPPHAAMRLLTEASVLAKMSGSTSPSLLHMFDTHGWLLLVLEHAPGDPVDLNPGSMHVDSMLRALSILTSRAAVGHSPLRTPPTIAYSMAAVRPLRILRNFRPRLDPFVGRNIDEWADMELDMIEASAGDTVQHSHLCASDFLVTSDRGVTVLDWAHTQLGPPWMDFASAAALLIEHGHPASMAERLVSDRTSAWWAASPDAITGHAVLTYAMWELRSMAQARANTVPTAGPTARAWLRWVQHRWTTYPFQSGPMRGGAAHALRRN